jgi:deoxyadenosine/deoxycytidine kinase
MTTRKLNYEIISIEGNIGSGKSTLLSNLMERYKNNEFVIFLNEPVDDWSLIKDANGVTMLEKFYADQEKYSFPFQMMAYISRLKILRDNLKKLDPLSEKKYIIITERSLNTDRYVFAKMLFESGKIEDVNYQIYLNWFDTFSEDFIIQKVIYVKTEPEKCFERICKRSREGEENIPLEYLKSCNKYHDDMLYNNFNNINNINKLILDGNIDIVKLVATSWWLAEFTGHSPHSLVANAMRGL